MIKLTRLNHVPLIVNADLIEHVEVTPDTVVALTTGQKFMVLETAEEVIDKVIQYRRTLLSASRCPHAGSGLRRLSPLGRELRQPTANEPLDVSEQPALVAVAERDGAARRAGAPRATDAVYVALGDVR